MHCLISTVWDEGEHSTEGTVPRAQHLQQLGMKRDCEKLPTEWEIMQELGRFMSSFLFN